MKIGLTEARIQVSNKSYVNFSLDLANFPSILVCVNYSLLALLYLFIFLQLILFIAYAFRMHFFSLFFFLRLFDYDAIHIDIM